MTDSATPDLVAQASRHYHAGDFPRAEALCSQILAKDPDRAEALHLLGLISSRRGQQQAARDLISRAIESDPLSAEYRTNLGVVLEALDLPTEAAASYRQAIEIRPELVDAHINLGNVLNKLQQFEQAIASYRTAVESRPQDPEIHNSLGAALFNAKQIEDALYEFARAIQLRPNFAEAYNNVGNALFTRGDAPLAFIAYQKAVTLNPKLADTYANLAGALERSGRSQEAGLARSQLAAVRLDSAPAQIAAGDAFRNLGLRDAAVESYRRAVEIEPKNSAATTRLGNALLAKMDLDGAVAAYRRALELDPQSIEVLNNLGVALKEQGLIDESLDCAETATELAPTNAAVHSNLIYLLAFHPGYDAAEQFHQQRLFNQRHAEPLKKFIRPHSNEPSPDRILKIGYVSPDLCQHVVGQNLFPLLREHDRDHFKIHCYASVPGPDAVTEMLRRHSDAWRDVAAIEDESLAEIIREDQIDILVDLSLHMARNRLLVFARKPAPVQLTYLGYCAGTGLDAIDYRFSDPYLDPPETDLSIYTEKTVRLPETYWCYSSAGPTPELAPPPCQAAGHITFGCLNNFAKVSPGTLDLWGQILAAVPGSRMIIHSYPGSHLDAVRQRLAAANVTPDRVEFVSRLPWSLYVQTYGRIDIALDPFPYGGGITTCDALWMGVPVITLAGQTAVGRGAKSILSNLGLSELVARRPRQYIQTAITLAASPARLTELRQTLRPRMLTSPLMNARRFTRAVENAYRQMWKQWTLSRGHNK